ncbi:MAG: TlpA disulfide reductase family protein [Aquabacterium sp.]
MVAALAIILSTSGFAATAADSGAVSVRWPTLQPVVGPPIEPAQLDGRPVILVFWATWCGFCERHNARIERLHRAVDPQALRIVGMAIDGDAASVARLARQRGWTFPQVLDEGRLRPRFTPRRLVPMTCVVDAQGQPQPCIPGEMSEDDVMALRALAAR